ncbi:hypothetical protein NIA69_17045 [Gemmiger formicilis]|nr:hypothetical protein [Gemmiger formicilis]
MHWDGFLNWLFDFEYKKFGIPAPDAVIYLAVDPEVSQRLITERYHGDESKKDIQEKDTEYLARSRAPPSTAPARWAGTASNAPPTQTAQNPCAPWRILTQKSLQNWREYCKINRYAFGTCAGRGKTLPRGFAAEKTCRETTR